MLYTSAILSFASRPWTRLIEDDLWYLPVNAAAGFVCLLVCVLRTEGSRETCDIGGMFDFVCVGVLPGS